jgi:hypothetical protein
MSTQPIPLLGSGASLRRLRMCVWAESEANGRLEEGVGGGGQPLV